MKIPKLDSLAWWRLNVEIGPWGSPTPLRFWTWRIRRPQR